MNDIFWLTMRRMRTPLIVLILVYALSVIGLVLIPGEDPTGRMVRMNFLDASYFIAILSTTIGLGEVPYVFSDAQRLYVFIIIYPNVIAWLYSIGTILSLFLDPQFKAVLQRAHFTRRMNWMNAPFYIVCGFGNTGLMIVRGLEKRHINSAIVEREGAVIHSLALEDDLAHLPALTGDVTDRRVIELAGLNHPDCLGIIAVTNDDHANLTIAITSKLLRPDLPVLARSESERASANMESFGTDFLIDPYSIFADRLYLALTSPTKYLVQDWLITVPGTTLRTKIQPPDGRWIIAGVGRFGSRMVPQLEKAGLPYTLVDVHPSRVAGREGSVLGRGTEAGTLLEAGVKDAVGIIAGTGDDIDNLSIIMTALELNPDLFVVARQENKQNDELFDSSGARLIARRSTIVARHILAAATTPLLPVFLSHLVSENETFAKKVKARMESILHGYSPNLWMEELKGNEAEGVGLAARENVEIRLEHITHNLRSENADKLDCVCLLLERGASRLFLPGPRQDLHVGDRLLFAGRGAARRLVRWNLSDPYALINYATNRQYPRGYFMRRFLHKRAV
jgi:Trk K+ transport system NAD-binding subunit